MSTNDIFYLPEDEIFGEPFENWTEKWWQWLLAIPKDRNPCRDPSGKFGLRGQKGKVFFLAGTMERSAVRRIRVPYGKSILFPMYTIVDSEHERAGLPLAAIGDIHKDDLNDMYSLSLTIDEGMPTEKVFNTGLLCQFRIINENPFVVRYPSNNIFDCGPKDKESAICGGYWAFIKENSLPRGQHTLKIEGNHQYYYNKVEYTINLK